MDANIWDASTVVTLDAITTKYEARGRSVEIVGLNKHSATMHNRLSGSLIAWRAGAASGLMNTTKQIGGALGLAVLVTAIGTHATTPQALATGYGHAFLLIAATLVIVAAIALTLPAQGGHRQAR